MIKGFISYKSSKIAFVIENFRMELFSENNNLLDSFINEYRLEHEFILCGQCFGLGTQGQTITFLVEYILGSTCYLRCYHINMVGSENEFDTIGFQSRFLDDVFRYKYNYIDKSRAGENLSVKSQCVYKFNFSMNNRQYGLEYRVGQDTRLGLLEDFDKRGELLVSLHTNEIQEYNDITIVLYRFAMFMISRADVPFKEIILYKNGIKHGWFYCPLISESASSFKDFAFRNFDVMKYTPKILNNISLDAGNEIKNSIPLGHLKSHELLFSPQRFIEQVISFEYLFDKLDRKRARSRGVTLKEELKIMFDKFPQLLNKTNITSEMASEKIKEIRRVIAHGYSYYYDFMDDSKLQFLILRLDQLILKMSLTWVGFTDEEINDYPIAH